MDMGSSTGDGPQCKISMLWNWYTIDACFLSSSWHVTSKGTFAVSCLGVICLVVTLEALRRAGREYDALMMRQFKQNAMTSSSTSIKVPIHQGDDINNNYCATGGPVVLDFRPTALQQFIRALLHAATFGVAYIIMLLAMYFNGFIIISIIIGAFLGKFICDWGLQKIVIQVEGQGRMGDAEDATFCCG